MNIRNLITIASEAVYEDYYKLKKRYEAENQQKSDALTRVDQVDNELLSFLLLPRVLRARPSAKTD